MDQSVSVPAAPAGRIARLRGGFARLLARLQLQPRTAWMLAALIAAGLGRYFWRDEGEIYNILFTVGVTLALIGLVALLSRRVLFATAIVTALVAVLVATSAVKRAAMNMVVHAYDFFFYLSSWSTISYLWSDQRRYVLGLIGALLAVGLFGWLVFRIDSTRIPRRTAAATILLSALLGWYGAMMKGERRHMQFYYENLYVSSFYASWGETLETLWRGALLEAAPRASASGPTFLVPNTCRVGIGPTRPPHIILIHEESVVQPSLFPSLRYDSSVDPFFRSDDNVTHAMRVETYGGASWLTEFSLLAGVSTHSFGGMRQFVQTFTQNKLKDTVPQVLQRCGYRNVVFYPMMKNFVSNDRFYNSIGLKEIFDMKVQGATSTQERDRFYYDNALKEMERHVRVSRKPMFMFIQTMSAHWPYNFKFEPSAEVAGGAPGTDPEMHEYLRRLSLAKLDYDHLLSELQRRFPRERFLVMHYGDHHPMATRLLLGFKNETEVEDMTLDADSIGFVTYYAAHGVNYRVPPMPQFDRLDVAYVGTVLLELAGLPLSDSHLERKRLMALCKGRYYGCAQKDEILAFHRRLIDSGVMVGR